MNGRVNDGVRTVHAITADRERTQCTLPRGGGQAYIGKLTRAPITCKLCLRKAASNGERTQDAR